MSESNKTNPLIIYFSFSPLVSLCSDKGINDVEKVFKSYYNSQGEEYLHLTYDEISKFFSYTDQVDYDEWVTVKVCFIEYFSGEIVKIIDKIKRTYVDLLKNTNTTLQSQVIEFENQNTREIETVKNIINTQVNNLIYREVLLKAIKKLENRKIMPILDLDSNSFKVIAPKKTKNIPNNYESTYFINVEVVETLNDSLCGKQLIDKIELKYFRKIFSEKLVMEEPKIKINWIGKIGLCKYFIEQLEREFDITDINSTKWHIANKCFTIANKPEYDFIKQGSNGKSKKPKDKGIIDEIIKKSINQSGIRLK